jgi:hypothetical protein
MDPERNLLSELRRAGLLKEADAGDTGRRLGAGVRGVAEIPVSLAKGTGRFFRGFVSGLREGKPSAPSRPTSQSFGSTADFAGRDVKINPSRPEAATHEPPLNPHLERSKERKILADLVERSRRENLLRGSLPSKIHGLTSPQAKTKTIHVRRPVSATGTAQFASGAPEGVTGELVR